MNFSDYYNLRNKKYEFRLKLALNDMSEELKEKITNCLVKYEIESVSFKKTPIQESPLDFPNIKNSEVYIADISGLYPVTPDVLRTELANNTGVSVANIAVFNKADPRLADEELHKERKSPNFKDNYKTAIGNDYDIPEKTKYGQELIDQELSAAELRQKQRDDKTVTNTLIPKQVTDTVSVAGPEKGSQGKDSPLTKVEISKLIPKQKQTLFSKD